MVTFQQFANMAKEYGVEGETIGQLMDGVFDRNVDTEIRLHIQSGTVHIDFYDELILGFCYVGKVEGVFAETLLKESGLSLFSPDCECKTC